MLALHVKSNSLVRDGADIVPQSLYNNLVLCSDTISPAPYGGLKPVHVVAIYTHTDESGVEWMATEREPGDGVSIGLINQPTLECVPDDAEELINYDNMLLYATDPVYYGVLAQGEGDAPPQGLDYGVVCVTEPLEWSVVVVVVKYVASTKLALSDRYTWTRVSDITLVTALDKLLFIDG